MNDSRIEFMPPASNNNESPVARACRLAKLQMSAIHGEAFKGQIGLCHEFLVDMEQLAAQGLLTPEELAEAQVVIEQDVAEHIDALRNATRRGMEAIDAHVARATDHIAKQGNSY